MVYPGRCNVNFSIYSCRNSEGRMKIEKKPFKYYEVDPAEMELNKYIGISLCIMALSVMIMIIGVFIIK